MMSKISQQQLGYVKSAVTSGLVFVLVFSVVFYGALHYRSNQQVATLTSNESARVILTKGLMTQAFVHPISDLLAISTVPATKSFSATRSEAGKKHLEQMLSAQLEQKPTYDQIRFLDRNGDELVRLDRSSDRIMITPSRHLQRKGTRYYFRETWDLSKSEVYVSPLDLNIENGFINSPYLPMVRMGATVFDQDDVKQGAVILNMQGQSLLNTFATGMSGAQQAYLLNSDGHILDGPDADAEWNFMFGLPAVFKREYPTAWQTISDNDSGKIKTDMGLFIYETVHPLGHLKALHSDAPRERDYFWKVVSFVPHSSLPKIEGFVWSWIAGLYLAGVVVIFLATFHFQFSRHKRNQLRQANIQQARRLHKITNGLGEGLIVLDKKGIITYINPETERILGWKHDELLNNHGHHKFHVHDGDEYECNILNVMNTGRLYRSKDEEFKRSDGVTIPVSLTAAPLTSDAGDEGVVVSFQDYSEIKSYQKKIHSLAYQDALTGLPNRRVLEDRLSFAIAFAKRHDGYLALMFLDLDHFKIVNDTYGHDAGDILLKEVAKRLKHCVRETDTVIRVGGDEFIVILTELASPENAKAVAEKIIDAVGQPVTLVEGTVTVGVSIGIAAEQGKAADTNALIQQADAAMYAAKEAGRNNFTFTIGGLPLKPRRPLP